MNSGKSKVDLQGLINFRKKLRERIQQVSEQQNATKKAWNCSFAVPRLKAFALPNPVNSNYEVHAVCIYTHIHG